MRPITYARPTSAAEAVRIGTVAGSLSAETAHIRAPVQYLGGGTQLLDLMKLDVMRPTELVDITRLEDKRMHAVDVTPEGVRRGALVTMRHAAEHPAIVRDYPVVSQSLWLAASQQLRNMGRLAGTVLQRTRCEYFRDTSWPCNKRDPGSGCSAIGGQNRWHAVLGTSEQCIASYPGDWATSLIAWDATVDILGAKGPRTIRFADLHRLPGNTSHIETDLVPGDLITAFFIPAGAHTRRSLYVKVRDRESYEYGLATAAVALDLDGDTVRAARIGIGGPVAKPWRAHAAEAALQGKPLTEANAQAAAKTVFTDARPREHNAFRIPLAEATLVRALMQAKQLEIA